MVEQKPMGTQDAAQGQNPPHPQGGPPGQTGNHPQGGAPGQNKPEPKTAEQLEADKQRRLQEAKAKMTERHLEDRIRAAHPYLAETDESFKAAMADYDRLVRESKPA